MLPSSLDQLCVCIYTRTRTCAGSLYPERDGLSLLCRVRKVVSCWSGARLCGVTEGPCAVGALRGRADMSHVCWIPPVAHGELRFLGSPPSSRVPASEQLRPAGRAQILSSRKGLRAGACPARVGRLAMKHWTPLARDRSLPEPLLRDRPDTMPNSGNEVRPLKASFSKTIAPDRA